MMQINPYSMGRYAYDVLTGNMKNPYVKAGGMFTGYTQYQNTKASTQAQIAYNDYIKAGNERAMQDWYRNVGGRRSIAYPELSYAGAIYRADTGSARAMYDSDNALANFVGNLPYRGLGLYGAGSRISRWL